MTTERSARVSYRPSRSGTRDSEPTRPNRRPHNGLSAGCPCRHRRSAIWVAGGSHAQAVHSRPLAALHLQHDVVKNSRSAERREMKRVTNPTPGEMNQGSTQLPGIWPTSSDVVPCTPSMRSLNHRWSDIICSRNAKGKIHAVDTGLKLHNNDGGV
ncbi:hypothetical protein BD310DRAFT_702433 [Dichomitus squalens]|uniref:Uncharacterized protein n=1 Tax=Dichomitus squalens TaxID=114155 RepID=A0A4Q9Q702_9APHY|nr:hypothetical protein BD310DRAFT_702433 [Dichomitus squalens]